VSDPLLTAIENLSRFHREHEKFYAQAPRAQAVVLQRHSRALAGLADRWSIAPATPIDVVNPFEGAEDLNGGEALQQLIGGRDLRVQLGFASSSME